MSKEAIESVVAALVASVVSKVCPNPPAEKEPSQCTVRKLTDKLVETYIHINKAYYKQKAEKAKQNGQTVGVTGRALFQRDKCVCGNYLMKAKLGYGAFGDVYAVTDRRFSDNSEFALKMIKSNRQFRRAALYEAKGMEDTIDHRRIGSACELCF